MKTGWIMSLGLILLSITAFGNGKAGAASPPGPYYATPSWDLTSPTKKRFVVLSNFGNNAVLDRETGLVWEKVPSTALFLGGPPSGTIGGLYAYEHCEELSLGNRKGWRLPSTYELMSLVDTSVSAIPKLPAGHPFLLPPPNGDGLTNFWSSDPYYPGFASAGLRRTVDFSYGESGVAGWPIPNYVWCVRGGSDSNHE
jgi:hypothetical protein